MSDVTVNGIAGHDVIVGSRLLATVDVLAGPRPLGELAKNQNNTAFGSLWRNLWRPTTQSVMASGLDLLPL